MSKNFYDLPEEEQKRLEIENRINYWRSAEVFEDNNPNKKAIYRRKETKVYLDWKEQWEA